MSPRTHRTRWRLLPLLIVAAGLALGARVGHVWQGLEVMAQTKAPAKAPAGGAVGSAPDEKPAAPEPGLPPDPLSMTDQEITLLQALAERRSELDERARRLDDREALLQAAERRIDEKVDGLKELRKSIEDLVRRQEEATETQYQSLVKIYENMRPKDAARIFDELDMAVLLPVVERMKERKTAPILADMNPEKAKAITTELARRRDLSPAKR